MTMRGIRTIALLTIGLLSALIAGCGGGGGGGAIDGGGIGGTGLHIGPNEGDGAVQVDGIAFNADSAAIRSCSPFRVISTPRASGSTVQAMS